MAKSKRKVPQINSSSSADIAFLLLIFFLITSSLDSQTGIYRKLSPEVAEESLKKKQDIEERNLLVFSIDLNDRIIYKEEEISLREVNALSKTFISNPNNQDYLPEKIEVDIPLIGAKAITSNHIVLIEIDRSSRYETYISLLNEITLVYNELRDEASREIFGIPFLELKEEQQEAIRAMYPLRIAEKEIKE